MASLSLWRVAQYGSVLRLLCVCNCGLPVLPTSILKWPLTCTVRTTH
uniref:Uncharacterized protein n=1 Tax=Anguilla anguilla TaxID=7936 RepID=A0A0E9QMD0_ANGAN